MSMFRLRDDAGDVLRGGVLAWIAATVTLVIVITIGVMAIFGIGWLQRGTADFRGKTNQINQIQGNGSYRIAAYDSFYDQCAGIQTDEQRVKNTLQELANTTDAARKAQLEANLDAQRNAMAGDINQYNADAKKHDTKGHFRASDLPYQIDPNIDPTKEITSCNS